MALDSDISNSDSHLHVEFYENDRKPYEGVPFVRIMIPGDKTTEIDQPVREDHKERFPRQWLYYQMKNSDGSLIGTRPHRKNSTTAKWLNFRSSSFRRLSKLQPPQILRFRRSAWARRACANSQERSLLARIKLKTVQTLSRRALN